MSMLIGRNRALLGGGKKIPTWRFNLSNITFTPYMDKRSTNVFATSPFLPGAWDGGTGDNIRLSRDPSIHKGFYNLLDVYQGSFSFWITPEWDGNDGLRHNILNYGSVNDILMYKDTSNDLLLYVGSQVVAVDTSTWTAGTTYYVLCRWDVKNTLDGTNYMCVSVNDTHTFGGTTTPFKPTPNSLNYIGSAASPANAIIEGLTVYRRPLYDGLYGVDAGNGDEINRIYAAGAGADPCLITGSWDVVFCLPTNSTAEALETGTGEAWSHPHISNLHEHGWFEDGGYLGEPWGVLFNGTTTTINCGSDVDIDDIADAEFTVEGWFRSTDTSEGVIICKGTPNAHNAGWAIYFTGGETLTFEVDCATTRSSVSAGTGYNDGKWHHFAAYFNDAGGADRKAYFALDGVWEPPGALAVGAIDTDAGLDLKMGVISSTFAWFFDGAIGWCAISPW